MGGDALSRRRLLNYLAASPLLASCEAWAQELRTSDKLIASPREALDVFDFEAVAKRNLAPAPSSSPSTCWHGRTGKRFTA